MFAQLALASIPFSIDRPYTYAVPEELEPLVRPGSRVFVPFSRGNRMTEGVVLSLSETCDVPDCKPVQRVAEPEPVFTPLQLKLACFMSERYFCTVYEALRVMIPAGYWFDGSGRQKTRDRTEEMVRLAVTPEEASLEAEERRSRSPRQAELLELLRDFGALSVRDLLRFTGADRQVLRRLEEQELVERYRKELYRRPERPEEESRPLPVLTPDQAAVLEAVRASDPGRPGLLFGVTGSGKTGIYAHLIRETLEEGGDAVLLVPEIALTPQLLSDFSGWFGDSVALLHSGLTAGERYDEWKRVRRGEAHVVLGTRSAVFAPVRNLRLIILDEEHEDSYRSESSPRYHARDIARWRGLRENARVLLGSATPDLCSRYLAQTGAYHYFELSSRYNQKPLPPVRVVDLKQELASGNAASVSAPLRDAIQERLDRGEQSILFLNRRGTNKMVTCSDCGHVFRCPHCSVSMTWHAHRRKLICHYCGTTRPLPSSCPECGGELRFYGAGTQLVEEELHQLFPGVGVLRVDADSVAPAGSHRALFRRFTEEKIPIMVGTQMIAKGLNFENVTLVGVLSADQSLYAGDFHAGERSFSLFTQVIGRCGRGEKPGEALIQTFTPSNQIIRFAARQDYPAFYESELELRRIQNAPPFRDWLSFSCAGRREADVVEALRFCASRLRPLVCDGQEADLFGPVPMPVVRVSDSYRYRLLLSCNATRQIRRTLAMLLRECGSDRRMRGLHFYVENDPSH